MTYPINFTDSRKSPILVNPSEETNIGLDISLFGRAFTEYGEQLNETLIRLLENFAAPEGTIPNQPDTTQTSNGVLSEPIEGQLWYNTTNQNLYYFNGTQWLPIGDRGFVAANWGQIIDGEFLPSPVSPSGYVFPYEECIWSVAPAEHQRTFDWMLCTTSPQAQVYCKYRGLDNNQVQPGIANYLIIGIKGNRSVNSLPDIYPTPTPSITPSNTPAPSPTESAAPPTPTPSAAAPSGFVGDLFVTSSSGNIDVYRMNGTAVPQIFYTWNWGASVDPGDVDNKAWGVWANSSSTHVVTVHNQYVRVHSWNPTTPVMNQLAKASLRVRKYFTSNFIDNPVTVLPQAFSPSFDYYGKSYDNVELYVRGFEFGNNIVIIIGSPTTYSVQVGTNINGGPILDDYTIGMQVFVFNKLTNTISFSGMINAWDQLVSVGVNGYTVSYQGDFGFQQLADRVVCLISGRNDCYQINVSSSGGISGAQLVTGMNTGQSQGQDYNTAGLAITNGENPIRWRSTGSSAMSGAVRDGRANAVVSGQPETIISVPGLRNITHWFTTSGSAIHYMNTDENSQTRMRSFIIPPGASLLQQYITQETRSTSFNLPVLDNNFPKIYSRRTQALTISGEDFILFGGRVTDVNSGTLNVNGIQVYKWILNRNTIGGQIHQYLTAIQNLQPPNSFFFVRRP